MKNDTYGATCVALRPDQIGNSRFEYTKIPNVLHVETLSGLASPKKIDTYVSNSISKKPTGYKNPAFFIIA
ncbi:MAG TPA: hypothetical protein PLG34_01215 [Spirochaetota bacterium]|nr:hypothetical protein [Spirochaetota bacterium]HPY86587.1 hypothetical protein [Spirochaetota bacterium]HQB60231.1 hypothetical protein [Spirochaetota bacterium]